MPWVTEEEIQAAKNMTAYEYLRTHQAQRLQKTRTRNEWQLTDHDSFKINELSSKWHWKSRDIGGVSALRFLIEVDGMKFTDALQWAGWIWRGTAVWDKGNSRPQKGRFRQQAEYIVWGSNGPMPINRPVSCLPGVFRYGNPQNRIHVTEKPLQLMKDVIQICEPGGLILDPFAGAGTTVLAAVMTGYRAVGIEVTDAYYKLGSDRVKIALEAEQKEDEK